MITSATVALSVLLAPVAASALGPAGTAAATSRTLPPVAAKVDYQLGGAYPLPAGVRVVTRDRTAAPAAGAYSICYVNAFQTQPQETQWWRDHHPDLLLRDAAGREVGDPGWPGEVLLDTRTPARRSALADVVGVWMGGCSRSGFAAVEPDNLDSSTRSRGLLTRSGNLAYARLLVDRAHGLGLAIAQKNTVEVSQQGRAIGFDFAVAEECQAYSECGGYTAGYGRHVIEVEYSDEGRGPFATACRRRAGQISIVYRDRDLVRPGRPAYVYGSC